jgi:hypothetical protein
VCRCSTPGTPRLGHVDAEDAEPGSRPVAAASLSQARKLTVVTKQGAVVSGAEWDL